MDMICEQTVWNDEMILKGSDWNSAVSTEKRALVKLLGGGKKAKETSWNCFVYNVLLHLSFEKCNVPSLVRVGLLVILHDILII